LHIGDTPYKPDFKVAVLTAWGALRSWVCTGHFNRDNYYNEVIESLSGLPLDVVFISFDDIINNGIPANVKVIINAGSVDDAWSGGRYWTNPVVIEKISEWVAGGGGFIGVGQPTSARHGASFFQLSNILGVDQELGLTKTRTRYPFKANGKHFILDGNEGASFANSVKTVHTLRGGAEVLSADGKNSVQVAANSFAGGRSVYMSGFEFLPENTRILHKAIFWAAKKEAEYGVWHCDNPNTECAYFPNANTLIVINVGDKAQKTVVTGEGGKKYEVEVPPFEKAVIEKAV
jgi:beta-D-galactosyl-(1->4)-L-rhamnose phosphorylase